MCVRWGARRAVGGGEAFKGRCLGKSYFSLLGNTLDGFPLPLFFPFLRFLVPPFVFHLRESLVCGQIPISAAASLNLSSLRILQKSHMCVKKTLSFFQNNPLRFVMT